MRVTFAHLCDYATISREGKLSVLGIFSNINTTSLPMIHPMLFVVFEIEMSAGELNRDIHAVVEAVDEDGKSIAKAEGSFRVALTGKPTPGERPRVPQVLPMPGLRFEKEGLFSWSIWLNKVHQTDIPFRVTRVQTPPETPV